jgi:hypothetical protein
MKRSFLIEDRPNADMFHRFTIRVSDQKNVYRDPPVVTTDEPLKLVELLLTFLREESNEDEVN